MHAASQSSRNVSHRNGAPRYDRVAATLHWAMAVLIGFQIWLGWWMQTVPKIPPGLRAGWFNVHKSVGLTLGLLLLMRLGWRLLHAPPSLSAHVPHWQRLAAATNHYALYACMLVLPLSGYLGSSFTRYPVRYFGIVLPQWARDWSVAKWWMSAVHDATAWVLVVLLALHVLAVLRHVSQHDTILARMWPFRHR